MHLTNAKNTIAKMDANKQIAKLEFILFTNSAPTSFSTIRFIFSLAIKESKMVYAATIKPTIPGMIDTPKSTIVVIKTYESTSLQRAIP